MNKTILFIAAGMSHTKKVSNPFSLWHYFLNFGALGLASVLRRSGFAVSLHHGHFAPPDQLFQRLVHDGLLPSAYPIFISVPSVFAIPWTATFCSLAKQLSPGQKIVLGGRWAIADDARWVKSSIPSADLIVHGTAEDRIVSLTDDATWDNMPGTDRNEEPHHPARSELPELDYSLLAEPQAFQPSVEISRGCGGGCRFCLERDMPLTNNISPVLLVERLERLCHHYASDEITVYFESSLFKPSLDWSRKFLSLYKERRLRVSWRAETRVDTLHGETLENLAYAGLKVLDIGLESASPRQLLAMGKTRDATTYLRNASDLVKSCHKRGIWAKMNILLYAGETRDTVRETTDWLSAHAGFIKGVSVNMLIAYRFGKNYRTRVAAFRELGATPVDEGDLQKKGYSYLHISDSVSYADCSQICIAIAKRFMTQKDYFDLKTFSYFPRFLDYSCFCRLLRDNYGDRDRMPFRVNGSPCTKE
jgi:hypothetical protein